MRRKSISCSLTTSVNDNDIHDNEVQTEESLFKTIAKSKLKQTSPKLLLRSPRKGNQDPFNFKGQS
ncbi:hypothetical protein Mapa_012429 [Marchantia paleacea]|nr:hypothetical protein Mapa_012429 [Marchantia paleacea]